MSKDVQFTLLEGFHRGWDSNRGFESRSLSHLLEMRARRAGAYERATVRPRIVAESGVAFG